MKNDLPSPQLAFTCPKRWDEMRVDGDQRRFCDQCQLHVHDLSAMTRREGQALLVRSQGQLCVSFESRADGSMVTRARWRGVARRWQQARRGVLAILAMLTPLAFGGCGSGDKARYERTGGKVCVAPPEEGKDLTNVSRLTGALPVPTPVEYSGRTLGRTSVHR